jgi:lactoylglutathione lyase
MQLGYIILIVPDVATTMAFYEQAFGLKHRFLDDTKKYGEMETGQTRLGFIAEEVARGMIPDDPGHAGRKVGVASVNYLGFTTENVEDGYKQALAAGAVQVKVPEKKPWGQIVSYIRDNNGRLVEICSPLP